MAAQPVTNVSRLQALRATLPYMSHRALSAVLQAAQQGPLPDSCSRSSVARSRDAAVKLETPYGPLHQHIRVSVVGEDDPVCLEVQHPFAILYWQVRHCQRFARFIVRLHGRQPSSPVQPWKLVIYTDEITPGNQMAYQNARKLWGWYWSVLDFGSAALSDEECVTFGFTQRVCGVCA